MRKTGRSCSPQLLDYLVAARVEHHRRQPSADEDVEEGEPGTDFDKMTVEALKEALKNLNLSVSGNKAELINRLKTHSEGAESTAPVQESNPWTGYHDEVLEALPSLFQPPVRVFMPGADAGEAFTWGAPKHTNSCGQEMWAKYTQEAQDKPSEKKIMDLITSLSNENSLMEVLPRLVEPIEDDTAHLPSYDVQAPPS